MEIVCSDKKTIKLGRKYLFDGLGSSGSTEGKKYYKQAVHHIKRGAKYSNLYFEYRWKKCDLEMAWEYNDKEKEEHKRVMELLLLAIERGHDMAVMQYAFFCMEQVDDRFRLESKTMNEEEKNGIVNELIKWIEKAYNFGFAPAAYMLAIIYRDGYYVIEPDMKKHKFYYSKFEELRSGEERQAVISTNIPVCYSDDEELKQLCYSAWISWLR